MSLEHISVMKKECLAYLNLKNDGYYVDGTLGRAGHTAAILKKVKKGHVYAFDLDLEAIKESEKYLKSFQNYTLIHDNYANIDLHLPTKVDGILLDLGVSSPQFDEASRGFSYRYDALLDMRMNRQQDLNAATIINTYPLEALIKIFVDYGEVKFAYKIASKIVKERNIKPINTTSELVSLIKEALPSKILAQKGHPAKQIFQALRIAVNDELGSLEKFLNIFPKFLNKDGTVVILSFHSLEDRLVKRRFKELSEVKIDKYLPLKPNEIKEADYKLLVHGGLEASKEEKELNPRSHSVHLRALRKVN